MIGARSLSLLLLLAVSPVSAGPVPDWLEEARRRPLPNGSDRAGVAVLHDEQVVIVPERGRVTRRTRFAIRLMRSSDADEASVQAPYVKGQSEVVSLRAWTLAAGGGLLRKWDRRDAADLSDIDVGQLYSEYRHLEIADDAIRPGETFAYEWASEETPLFADWTWWFASGSPSAWSVFELRLPGGLEPRVFLSRADGVESAREGNTWRWSMKDVAAIPREPYAPSRADLGAFLHVRALPAVGTSSPAGTAFREWRDLCEWLANLAEGAGTILPQVAARARAISAPHADTLHRIRALAHFVRGLNYVSRDEHIARGWGYRPHDAATVLAAGFGDCKDKANLLCTMLRSEGIEAWLLLVHSGSRDRVDSAWVSPRQFNHCIAAIRVPDGYRGPLLAGGQLGPLAVFDPTDPLTVFGDLPGDQQGSLGLLLRPGAGALLPLPVVPEEGSRVGRRVDASLDPDGRLTARLVEESRGQHARANREVRRASGSTAYRRVLESWLAAQGGAVELASSSVSDDSLTGDFRLEASYSAPAFARPAGSRMLTYRPALLAPRHTWMPEEETRTLPISLPALCVEETLSVRLPEGFALDERPADMRFYSDLGALEATFVERDGALVLTRRFQVRPVTVEAARWADVRALFEAQRAASQATAVLVRR